MDDEDRQALITLAEVLTETLVSLENFWGFTCDRQSERTRAAALTLSRSTR